MGRPQRYLLLIACVVGVGSWPTSKPVAPAGNSLEISAADYGRFFQAAVATLREAGFQIDRHDYRFGRITTMPLPQATALEFWRPTTAHSGDPLASTLNYQRLIACVSFERLAPGGSPPVAEGEAPNGSSDSGAALPAPAYSVGVQVDVEQLERPASYVNGSSTRVFATLSRSPAELAERGIPALYWRPVAHDEKLEHDLLQRILRRSTQSERE